jgi:hypothetical protein
VIFWEDEASDRGPVSFRLVVLSSCIELGFPFLGRAYTEGRTGVLKSVGPTCTGDREVGMHTCVPAYSIGAHGSIGKGEEGVHYVCTCWLNRRPYVRACVVNMRA